MKEVRAERRPFRLLVIEVYSPEQLEEITEFAKRVGAKVIG